MDLSTMLVFLLYGAAIAFIVYFMLNQQLSAPIIIRQESPVTYAADDSAWWPWGSGTYNYWPYWGGWWSGGGNGGYYHRRHYNERPRFGGGPRGQLGGAIHRIGTPAGSPGGRTMGGMTGGRGGGGRGGGGKR